MELVKNRQQLLNIFKIIFLTIVKDKFSFKVWLHAMEFCFVFPFPPHFLDAEHHELMTYIKGHKHCAWLGSPLPLLGWKSSHSPAISPAGHQGWWGTVLPAPLPPDSRPRGADLCPRGQATKILGFLSQPSVVAGGCRRIPPSVTFIAYDTIKDASHLFCTSKCFLFLMKVNWVFVCILGKSPLLRDLREWVGNQNSWTRH